MLRKITPSHLVRYKDQSFAYRHFDPGGAAHIVCPLCRALVLLFEELSPDARAKVTGLRWNGESVQAVKILEQGSGCARGHAKAAVLHLRTEEGTCHNCAALLKPGSLLCPDCLSVNLDWGRH